MILQMMLLTHMAEVRASYWDRFKETYLFYHMFGIYCAAHVYKFVPRVGQPQRQRN